MDTDLSLFNEVLMRTILWRKGKIGFVWNFLYIGMIIIHMNILINPHDYWYLGC